MRTSNLAQNARTTAFFFRILVEISPRRDSFEFWWGSFWFMPIEFTNGHKITMLRFQSLIKNQSRAFHIRSPFYSSSSSTSTKTMLASQLRKSLEDPKAIIIDVRTLAEIEASGKFQKEGRKWFQTACSPTACDHLHDLTGNFPDKEAPVIVYCRSGRRASKAKEMLEGFGYKKVLNAGGYDDLLAMDL